MINEGRWRSETQTFCSVFQCENDGKHVEHASSHACNKHTNTVRVRRIRVKNKPTSKSVLITRSAICVPIKSLFTGPCKSSLLIPSRNTKSASHVSALMTLFL